MTIKENLTSYYDAFKITNDIRNKGDITTFVYEFLNIVYKAYEKTEMYALSKKSELESYLSRIDKLKLSKNNTSVLQILLQAELFSEHGVTVLDLVNNLGLSDSTCRKVLDYLIVHELVHLECPNHSREFWDKVGILLPEYENSKDWLTQNGIRLDI